MGTSGAFNYSNGGITYFDRQIEDYDGTPQQKENDQVDFTGYIQPKTEMWIFRWRLYEAFVELYTRVKDGTIITCYM
ncbi:hypothetical protein Tco_0128537 [Tanacetum coccineum]